VSTVTTAKAARLQIDDTLGRRVVVIDKPVFRIGRKSESDLRPVSVDVSREHAEIALREDGKYVLKDRGSRYGTFVNDEQVTERPLKHHDRIRLGRSGSAELVFLLDDGHDSRGTHISGVVDFKQISTLLDRLRAMGSARVLDEVLELVMDSAIEATGAERGFIMLASRTGELEFKIGRARGRVTLSGRSFATSQKIPQQVFSTGREQIVADLMEGNFAGDHLGTVALGIRNVLCTPLRVVRYLDQADGGGEQQPIGVLYLDSREKGHLLSANSRSALETVATEAASAIESARLYREAAEKGRLERELQLAAEIQRSLLPEADQSGPHFEVAAASIPCRSIGGDFFDYFNLPDGRFGFALGDVAGKGPPAALLTAMIQGIFSAQVAAAASPASLMSSVNGSLIRRSIQNRFATVVYGALSSDGGLSYSNAGHNPPVLLRRDSVQRLETGGLILGLFPQAMYEEEVIALEDGDVLVIFSDGVTEAFNAAGEDFGEDRLLECLRENRCCEPAVLLQKVLAAVQVFASGAAQSDDVTALVLRYRRSPATVS
jgi:sigma-B regulation protein RsbU (phosphoserine phosphatase)